MIYSRFGRTELQLSRVGLGAGGPSRLGTKRGASQDDVERLIGTAVDLGVTLIDTARGYGTEAAIGKSLQALAAGHVIVATKTGVSPSMTVEALVTEIETSLTDLRREALDIFQFHAVLPEDLDDVVTRLLPVVELLREQGKIRHVGITENPSSDVTQETASRAAASGRFDTLMVQYGVFDQAPAPRTFAHTRAADMGLFCMSAARGALVHEEMLAGVLQHLGAGTPDDLRFLLNDNQWNWSDLAFRFAAACADIDVVLVGTGNAEHFRASAQAVLSEPLPAAHVDWLRTRFAATQGEALWAAEG